MTEIPHVTDPSLMAGSVPTVESRLQQLDMAMLSRQSTTLDINASPVYSASEIGLAPQAGEYKVRVLAELALPGHEGGIQESHLAVLQVANARGEVRYALHGLTVDENGKATAARTQHVAIDPNSRTLIGGMADSAEESRGTHFVSARSLWGGHGTYSTAVSPVHLELIPDARGGLTINDVSKTGTGILRNRNNAPGNHIEPHIQSAYELGLQKGLIKDGKFAGRPIIDYRTQLGGNNEPAVDINSWGAGGEAIVVGIARETDKQAYAELRQTFADKIAAIEHWSGHKPAERDVLRAIGETVAEKLEYDLPFVNDATDRLKKLSPESQKVNLSFYLDMKKGVCRHMSLAAAWLGGEAKTMGLLNGKMFVQANQDVRDNAAHQWVRYKDKEGNVSIIDPTLGGKEAVQTLKEAYNNPRSWYYMEEGEQVQLDRERNRAAALGNAIITHVPDELFDQEKQ